jgi:hypothetical protein
MLSKANGILWMDEREDQDSPYRERTNNDTITNTNNNCGGVVENNKDEMGSLSTFKSMLEIEDEWYSMVNKLKINFFFFLDLNFKIKLKN